MSPFSDVENSFSTDADGTVNKGERDDDENEEAIAKRETCFVRCMRLLVLAVMVSATAGVGYAVYWYLNKSEAGTFERDFQADSAKVMASIGTNMDLTLTALDSFVVTMLSFARATNASWPFVTFPNFEVRASKIRALSKAVYLSNYVRVSGEQREDWEAYADENNAWLNESFDVQKTDKNFHGPIIEDFYVLPCKCRKPVSYLSLKLLDD